MLAFTPKLILLLSSLGLTIDCGVILSKDLLAINDFLLLD